jgi:hypothetical protein
VTSEIAARLENLQINWTFQGKGFAFFNRGNVAVFARCSEEAISLGSSGMMTDNGLAYLIWRDEQPILAAHGGKEISATPEQVEEIQRFSADLKNALGLTA